MRCFYIISSFINYGFFIIVESNKCFKFPAFLGNDISLTTA